MLLQSSVMVRWLCVCGLVFWLTSAQAASNEVEKVLDSMHSFTAEFTQIVKQAHLFQEERSQGKVWVERPGKFNWRYEQGAQKMDIIADGVNLWIYQPTLSQVMVQPLADIEKDLPISWLASTQPIGQRYNTRRLEDKGDGLTWFDLQNKQGGTQEVAFIELALQGNLLKEVLVTGSDGKETRVIFKSAKRDVPISESQFQYRPEPNIDIIGTPR